MPPAPHSIFVRVCAEEQNIYRHCSIVTGRFTQMDRPVIAC